MDSGVTGEGLGEASARGVPDGETPPLSVAVADPTAPQPIDTSAITMANTKDASPDRR